MKRSYQIGITVGSGPPGQHWRWEAMATSHEDAGDTHESIGEGLACSPGQCAEIAGDAVAHYESACEAAEDAR